MNRPRMFTVAGLFVSILSAAVPEEGRSFSHFAVGDSLPNVTLATLDGKQAPLLRKDRKVNVFFFFRPDQDNSLTVLDEVARCEKELAGKSVNWVGVVSDFYKPAEALAVVKKAGVKAPILIDKGDALYGKLGLKLHPAIGIADGSFKLLAFQPFTKLNYCVVVKARIQFALGEITAEQLEATVNPPRATQGGDEAKAKRDLNFAKMLHKGGKLDKALLKAREAVEKDPKLAEAHGLVGAILAAQGDCKSAAEAFGQALALDPKEPQATAGAKTCGSTAPTAAPTAQDPPPVADEPTPSGHDDTSKGAKKGAH